MTAYDFQASTSSTRAVFLLSIPKAQAVMQIARFTGFGKWICSWVAWWVHLRAGGSDPSLPCLAWVGLHVLCWILMMM
jgi:hypothetical protein